MARPLLLASACLLVSLTAPSCRGLVFEDRTPCPSWVTVIVQNPVPDTEETGAVLHLWKDGAVRSCGIHSQEELSQGVTVAIRKGEAAFSGLAGIDPGTDGSAPSLLTVPPGRKCPPWYAFSVPGRDYEEGSNTTETDQWQMFGNLIIDVLGAGYEFRAVCHCGVDGFEYPSLALHEGAFDGETDTETYNRRTIRIPRQSLGEDGGVPPRLQVDFDYHDPVGGNWITIHRVNLASYLEQGRYDWAAPLLEDIRLEVELERGSLVRAVLLVEGWKRVLLDSGGGNLIL